MSERVLLTKLKPDPKNVRRHSERNIAAVRASLERFGQQTPIVADADGMIVKGNATVEAARSLGWDSIEVVRTELVGAEQRAYAIADNRSGELAEWDDPGLAEALKELDAAGVGLESLGFTADDLAELEAGAVPTEIVEDEVPAVQEACITRPGDLWLLGDHRVLCGDSTKAEDVGRVMGGQLAACLFTSPPYWAKQEYDRKVGLKAAEAFMRDVADILAPVVRRRVVINTGNTMEGSIDNKGRSGVRILLDSSWVAAWRTTGWELRNRRIWVKSGPIPHVAPISDVVDESCEALLTLARPGKNEGGQERCDPAWAMKGYWDDIKGVGKDVIGDDHPCPFPVELAGRFVRLYSKASDVILDPFLGSGTTLIAAEQLKRRCYGLEIEPRYCDVICRRWECLTGRDPVRESDGTKFGEVNHG